MRRLLLMATWLLGILAAASAVNRVGDPYGAWQAQLIDGIYRKRQDDRISRPYRLLRERPMTVLLGNSRMAWGIPIDGPATDGVFNAALPGCRFDELDAITSTAIQQPQVKRLIWALDFLTFDELLATSPHDVVEAVRARLRGDPWQLITEALLSLNALEESVRIIGRVVRTAPVPADSALPRSSAWSPDRIREEFAHPSAAGLPAWRAELARQQAAAPVGWYGGYRFDETSLQRVRDLVGAARSRGIDVVIVVLPATECELEIIRQTGRWDLYLSWERRLAEIGAYWDFSGYNELAREDSLFNDLLHLKPAPGHAILRRLLGEDCGACGDTAQRLVDAGVWVDEASIDEHIAAQDALRNAWTREPSPYAKIVAEAIDQDSDGDARP